MQSRQRASTADLLSSMQRLSRLSQTGSVTIDERALDEASRVEAAASGAQLLREIMRAHGLTAIDIVTTVTEPEFLKLCGLLAAPPSPVHGTIVESADALAIWNIRLRVQGRPRRATPASVGAEWPAAVREAPAGPGAPPPAAPRQATASAASESVAPRLAEAVRDGDGAAVCRLLAGVSGATLFQQLATPAALQLVVEALLDDPAIHEAGYTLLVRAGVTGARAVFDQLIACTSMADRRVLYDLAASLPDTLSVASQFTNDPTWFVARNAAGLLGESRNPSAIPDLARLLRHTDTRVRVAAVVALGQIGGARAMARLESVLLDPAPDVRNRALSIVFGNPDADPLADRLLLAVQEESTHEYQLEIISALAHVQTPRARQRLVDFTRARSSSYEDLQIRLAAISALAAGHRPDADEALRQLTRDADGAVRERAASMLRR